MAKILAKKSSFIVKLLKVVFGFTLSVILVSLITGTILYINITKDLPKLDNLSDYQPPIMAEVYAENGKKIGEFWEEARIVTPIEKIPKKLIEGFVASEDDRFFEHSGVDFYSIFRAFWRNFQAGHVVEGGSTITQQLTKTLVLTSERTYDRKIKEAILATRIEKNLGKEQILYLYLNQIYFGNRAYGVAAAARNYFHKDLEELSVPEIAMIVGLSKGPGKFNPIVNPDRAISRQHYVLDRMATEGYITQNEAATAKKTPLKIYKAGIDKDFNMKFAPYFVEHVRRYLKEKYGDAVLYKGGWQIYTTLDYDVYKYAEEAVQKGLLDLDKRYGYRGPLRHYDDQSAIEAFLINQHIQLCDEEDLINYFGYKGEKEVYRTLKTPIQPNRLYTAVITDNVGGLSVKIGNQQGYISSEDSSFARSAGIALKSGDVIEVMLKIAGAENSKKSAKGTAVSTQPQLVGSILPFKLSQTPEIQSALYSYEPFSGKLKAIIGGFSFKDSEFDRATQALRQPGSSIKPLIYAAALDKGYTPNTVIMDSPIHYPEGNGKFWDPQNYGKKYYGPTLFRNALVNSRNVVTVRILMDVGTHYVDAYMRKVGISSPIFKFYSMALGATEVYLAELTRAFGIFPTGGVLPDIYFIKKIVDPTGKVIETHQENPEKYIINWSMAQNEKNKIKKPEQNPNGNQEVNRENISEIKETPKSTPPPNQVTIHHKRSYEEMSFNEELLKYGESLTTKDDLQLTEYERKVLFGDYIPKQHVISPNTAVTMTAILQDVVRMGTGARANALGIPAAGKTGTTNSATDTWFIGFTPNLVAGVWVGFDKKIKSIGHGATGGSISVPIWLAYMKQAVTKYPVENFVVPKGINLTAYQTPIQVVGIGDAELGDIGLGTGVDGGGRSGGNSSASFFSQDLDF